MASKDIPVYAISIAAYLAKMHPQTLRMYERKGLIKPGRSAGRVRLYSERDIERLRLIQLLTQDWGVNLAGVKEILQLREELEAVQDKLEKLQEELVETHKRMEFKTIEMMIRYSPQIVRAPASGLPVPRNRGRRQQ